MRRLPVVAGVSLFSAYRAVRYTGTVPGNAQATIPLGGAA